MSQSIQVRTLSPANINRFRDRFASKLGVSPERKEAIYLDISRAATLLDPAYWLQILFAAGIATLGLVLNSPAVIIGAMLISPLMGPILAAGLALAAGDVILGLRAIINLGLSCLVAVLFAVTLVTLLPFREMTSEIAARTEPNTLDLVVALFSGAIGSIATCREVKGVVTSIPGVAIAVALMPPLCVVGYGVGIALSVSGVEGARIASGGGLLFLTNLVAITFTAMVVFLSLHIDTRPVKDRVSEWRQVDPESKWFRDALARFHISDRVRVIGGLPGRFIVIGIPLLLILIPLSQSFSQLRGEIAQQRQENQVRQKAQGLWEQYFGRLANGEPRSYIDQLTTSQQDGKLNIFLRVFTSKPYTATERAECARLMASHFGLAPEAVGLQLIEIPTASGEIALKAREERRVEPPPTVGKLQAGLMQGVAAAISGLRLPAPAHLVGYSVLAGSVEPFTLTLNYLSDRDIDPDARNLIAEDVQARFGDPAAKVIFARIPTTIGQAAFNAFQTELTPAIQNILDAAGETLTRHPGLRLEIAASAEKVENGGVAARRAQKAVEYLMSKWQIAPEKVTVVSGLQGGRAMTLTVKPDEGSR